jgi:hypothetical protein
MDDGSDRSILNDTHGSESGHITKTSEVTMEYHTRGDNEQFNSTYELDRIDRVPDRKTHVV